MRFWIEQADLASLVKKASSTAAKEQSGRPILNSLLIDVQADRVRVLSTDLHLGLVLEHKLERAAEPGRFLVPHERFVEACKKAPPGLMMLVQEGAELHVAAGYAENDGQVSTKSLWSLRVIDPEAYPDFPTYAPSTARQVSAKPLADAVRRASIGLPDAARVEKDVKLAHLDGICLADQVAYAADFHVAVRVACPAGLRLFLPRKAVQPLLKLLDDMDGETFGVCIDREMYVLFEIDGQIYHSHLVVPRFPNIEAGYIAVTDAYDRSAVVGRADLLAALKRACVTVDRSYWLTLAFDGAALSVKSADSNRNRFSERVDGVVYSQPTTNVERHVNLETFTKMIQACRGDVVTIRFDTGAEPARHRVRVDDDGMVAVLFPQAHREAPR